MLIDKINNCFLEIINDEDFILGLDYTGVYAFTQSRDTEATLQALYELRKDLQLDKGQIVLCYVGEDESPYEHGTTEDRLEEWVIRITSQRPRIFSGAVLKSIEECYDEEEMEDSQLVNVLREYNLNDTVIHYLIEHRPNSVQEVKRLGVVDEVAYQVYRILQVEFYESNTEDKPQFGTTVTYTSRIKRKGLYSFACVFISAALVLLLNQNLVAIIISLIGIAQAISVGKMRSVTAVKLALMANVTMMITALWQMCGTQLIRFFTQSALAL